MPTLKPIPNNKLKGLAIFHFDNSLNGPIRQPYDKFYKIYYKIKIRDIFVSEFF